MNMYKFELRSHLKSMLIWSLTIAGLMLLFMAVYPAFSSDTALMDSIISNYPEEMLKAFGMNTGLPLSSVLGYLVFIFPFIQLALAIQSANYGFAMLSEEERELTADFLMSKPVSRGSIFVSKFMATFTVLAFTNLTVWGATFLSLHLFDNGNAYDADKIILFLATIVIFQLFFIGIGMLISVIVKKIRSVLSYSMALAFGLYILNALRNIIGGESLGVVSPYYYFDPGYILEQGSYNMAMLYLSIGVVLISLITSYLLYSKRNIHSL